MINVSELIGDPEMGGGKWPTRTLTRTRVTDGERAGEFDTVQTTGTVIANIQPASDWQKLNMLPEGQRGDDAIRIYSLAEIPDTTLVTWRGNEYKVASKKRWMDGGYCLQLAVQNDAIAR
jgi:hypothetical protein